MGVLTKENVIKYKEKGMSDSEIAKQYSIDRTTVVHFRKQNNICMMPRMFDKALNKTIKRLEELGLKVKNKHFNGKKHESTLLINDQIRVSVKSAATTYDETFRYSLTEPSREYKKETSEIIRLKSGRYKKLYSKTCDYLIFFGESNNETTYWIIPSKDLLDDMQTVSLPMYSKRSKYNVYKEAWHLLV